MKFSGQTALMGLVFLAACSTTEAPADTEASPHTAMLSGDECPYNENGAHLFWLERPAREAGGAVQLHPYFSTHPGHFDPLPPGCIGDMSATPEEAVEFSRGELGDVIVRLTDKAKPGTSVIISTNYGGHDEITGIVDVYDADARPLVGRWTQTADPSCSTESIIRELKFNGDGTFSVTWMPFEAYKDYWGDFDYETQTGLLSLKPDGGNYVPDDVSSGMVRLAGDTLTLMDGMSFGATRAGETCSAPFERR